MIATQVVSYDGCGIANARSATIRYVDIFLPESPPIDILLRIIPDHRVVGD